MRSRFVSAVVTAWVLAAPEVVPAQFAQLSGAGTSVTFIMPVNLTQLSSDLERVKFLCLVGSDALQLPANHPYTQQSTLPSDEVWVIGGQLVTTMKVIFFFNAEFFKDPIGKTAEYQCGLLGFSKSLQRWDGFSETSTVPAFLLKGSPAEIKGTFVW